METKLHDKIQHILLKEWDPIGIKDYPGAQDEYDSYCPDIYELLVAKKPVSEIFAYLWWVVTVHIGLEGTEQVRLSTEAVAYKLAHL